MEPESALARALAQLRIELEICATRDEGREALERFIDSAWDTSCPVEVMERVRQIAQARFIARLPAG